jgi:uncharacterized protein YbgA (DUF1722 family)
MNTDSWIASAIWGRVGAAILALASFVLGYFGYTLAAEDQAAAYDLISAFLAGMAGLMALLSKVRETKKKADG